MSGWGRFRRRRLALIALVLLGAFALVALCADLIASDLPIAVRVEGHTYVLPARTRPPALAHEDMASLRARAEWLIPPLFERGPDQPHLDAVLHPPGADAPLGTDELGRDVLARLVHGARLSLVIGLLSVGLYVLIGVVLGALAGWFGGVVDTIVSRVTEVMLAFPTFFLVLAILGVMRVESIVPVMVVIGLTRWTDVSRLVRGEVLRLKTEDYVQASRALGAPPMWVIARHLLPNALGPVLVNATFGIAGAILIETALSFLGFGVPPPQASWGELLTQAHRYVTWPGAWWLTLFPGMAIFFTVTALNLVGEGLRDAFDPRLR
ncbi:MAG: ABC transporter permease [Myxococcaceae bacterium]|nr:ABC transporter permease [Myxococcaceae bacterium]